MNDSSDEAKRARLKELRDNPLFGAKSDPSKEEAPDASQESVSFSVERDFRSFSGLLKRSKNESSNEKFDNLFHKDTIRSFIAIREFVKADHDRAKELMVLYQDFMATLENHEDVKQSFLTAMYDQEEADREYQERHWEFLEKVLLVQVSYAITGDFDKLEREVSIGIVARQKFESFFEPKLYAKTSKMVAKIEELYEAHDLIFCRIWQNKIFVALQKMKADDFNRRDFKSREDCRKWMDRYYCTTTERSEENTQVRIYEETHDTISRFEKKEFLLEFERKSVFLTNEKGKSVRFDMARDWLSVPHRHYDRVIFDRSAPFDRASTTFNKFRGNYVSPSKNGAYDLLKELWKKGICSDDVGLFKWTFAWKSFLFKRPGEKPGTSIVLRGGKGAGKTQWEEVFGYLLDGPLMPGRVGKLYIPAI